MKGLVLFLLTIISQIAFSQENYAVSAIPKELLYRAKAVVRTEDMTISVNSLNDVNYHKKEAITILNSAGDDMSSIVIWYNNMRQLKSVKGVICNEFGQIIQKFTEKDFRDRSAVNDISLYEDDRVKIFSPAVNTYPYTIVYEYDIKSKQSLSLPEWQPAASAGVAVESSTLRFVSQPDFTLRYKEINYPGKVTETVEKGYRTYLWQVKNMPALKEEPFSPDPEKYLVTVKLAPVTFAFKGIKGSFSNWQEFGSWMNENILKNRDVLPPETVNYIRELTADVPDAKARAKAIYEYMQKKTRYISVQIGAGGFQPYSAADVDRMSYGDCKGLVNYTRALLKAAGIESYYCIVNSGSFRKDVSADFASMNDGDHIILCLPFKGDTTWLECTSKNIPFGFLGDFTDNRLVVACTPEGGKLLMTPTFANTDNRQVRKALLKLNSSGDLNGTINTSFEGCQYENRDGLQDEPLTEQIKKLQQLYPIPNFKINNLALKLEKNIKPRAVEDISFSSIEYASLNNGSMYLSLNVINREKEVPPLVMNRSNPVYINRGYIDEDEFVFELPENVKFDYIPQKVLLEKPFGKYSAEVLIKGNKAIYHRLMQINEGTYPKDQYEGLTDFYQKVAETDMEKLVLKF